MSHCNFHHKVGPAFSSVPRPTGEAECLAWKMHDKQTNKKDTVHLSKERPVRLNDIWTSCLTSKGIKLMFYLFGGKISNPFINGIMLRCYCMIKMKIFISYNIKNLVAMTTCCFLFLLALPFKGWFNVEKESHILHFVLFF